ncbi:hypothetical protein [Halococcus saccharolyticus]|uniref:Uncharacterized protein n=1 Tax=Halococcus saccharolyticus DSM 5350 TaxID=1227455 RepID=M0MBV5_9EURY|nr:hypothetical protein [Halococcus saccharolyticus]EMA43257.1 hypothetical protein C449_14802 [Halococcus saccharolyticus DSM 5350]
MAVSLGADVLSQYRRFSLYNSPYVAHEQGRAIDLYPDAGLGPATDGEPSIAPSPVAGEVLETRTVRAPPKSHAEADDHLLLVDTGEHVARVLHVEPTVSPGESITVGDPLGRLVRAGFFAPWVDNHVHLEFRPPDANPYRASGSLPLAVDVPIAGLDWDGVGTVVESGDTYAVLDSPSHPDPGEGFVGIAADDGAVVDGGLVHYTGGGALATDDRKRDGPVSLLGRAVGHASGRDVAWKPLDVLANGERITGLSLFCGREAEFGAKLVCPDTEFDRGEHVTVELRPSDNPIRLG